MLVIFFFEKGASKYLKMPFYVSESFPINCVMPMVLLLKFSVTDELATRLIFGEIVEFLQAALFVLCETLVQSVEVKAVKNKHTQ